MINDKKDGETGKEGLLSTRLKKEAGRREKKGRSEKDLNFVVITKKKNKKRDGTELKRPIKGLLLDAQFEGNSLF